MDASPLAGIDAAVGDSLRAMRLCVDNKLLLPSIAIFYTTVDAVAALEHGRASRSRFVAWVDRYMLVPGRFAFTAEELYAARCAIVHSLAAESDDTRAGRARMVAYAWGSGTAETLRHLIQIGGRERTIVAASLEDMLAALTEGFAKFKEELSTDRGRLEAVIRNPPQFLSSITVPEGRLILNAHDRRRAEYRIALHSRIEELTSKAATATAADLAEILRQLANAQTELAELNARATW